MLALAAGRPVFTAGNPANIIIAGKVVSFVDWNDPTHFLTQPNVAIEVPAPVADPDFNGKLVITSDGTQGYQSTKPASFYSYTMDGVSFESFRVFAPSNVGGPAMLLDGTDVSPGIGGYQAYLGGVPGKSTATLLNTVGSSVNASYGTLITNAPIYTDIRFELAGAGSQYELRTRGTLEASGPYSSPPSPSGPSRDPLRILTNSYPAITFAFVGRWAAVLHFPALTPAQRAIVHAWLLQEYGIAPSLFDQVLQLAQGRPCFTANNIGNVQSAGKLVSIRDWNDTTHFLTQSAGPAQVNTPAPAVDFNLQFVATFTGAQAYVSTRPAADWSFARGGDVEHWFGYSIETAAPPALPEATGTIGGSAALRFQADVLVAPSTLRVNITGVSAAAFTTGVPTYYGFRHVGSVLEVYRRGAIAAPSVTDAPAGPPDGPYTLGSLGYPPISFGASMRWAFSLWFPPLTPTQRAIVHAWIFQTYAIPAL